MNVLVTNYLVLLESNGLNVSLLMSDNDEGVAYIKGLFESEKYLKTAVESLKYFLDKMASFLRTDSKKNKI